MILDFGITILDFIYNRTYFCIQTNPKSVLKEFLWEQS